MRRTWLAVVSLVLFFVVLALTQSGLPDWLQPQPPKAPPVVATPPPVMPPSPPSPPTPATPPRKGIELERLPPITTDNKNTLIDEHRQKLTFAASSTWPGYPELQAVDGKVATSWFSAGNDSAAKGKTPWLQVIFPQDVTVSHITVLGNRDPTYLNGYTILSGRLELLDAEGKVLYSEANDGTGNFRDFDFKFNEAMAGVRSVRFTSLRDQGDQNSYGDIAIAEIQVE